jgi:hypothetical protein
MMTRIVLALFLFCSAAQAATYTVCSLGCTATTFTALFAAVDLEPDDIVEARADTPGGSKTFIETITPGANDYGSAGHPLIIRARTGDTITIQGPGDTGYASSSISHSGSNGYITFDGFTLTNYGYAGVRINGTSATIKVPGIVIQNITANTTVAATATDTTECFFLSNTSGAVVRGNTCNVNLTTTNQTDGYVFTDSSDVDLNGNSYIDNNGNGVGHNDGFQTWQASAGTAYNGPYTIRNNTFVHRGGHSDALQLMYFEYRVVGNNYIYNNVAYLSYSPGGAGSNMISVYNKNKGVNGNFYFYNNTFLARGNVTAFISDAYSSNINFKNNVIYSEKNAYGSMVTIQNTTGASVRNNLYYSTAGDSGVFLLGSTQYTFANWDSTVEAGTALWGNPLFTSMSAYPYDLSLQVTSPAINAGLDLSSVFIEDILGNTRTGTWDIGAYEYGASGGDTYYASPTGGGSTCSIASPCTLSTGLGKLTDGDTLYLRAGSYTGGAVTFATNGSSSSRITISGYPGETAIIDGQNTYPADCYSFLVNISGDYVTIQNLQIKNSYGAGLTLTGDYSNATNIVMDYVGETGIVAQGTGNIIDGCTVSRNGQGYVQSRCSYWGSAICSTGTNATIKNSTAYNNRGEGFNSYLGATGTIIQDNISYDNGSVGLYLDSTTYATAQRNLVYYTSSAPYGRASCITVGGETGQPSNLIISNNATIGCRLSLEVDSNVTTLTSVAIENNTFANASKTAQDLSDGYNMNVYFRPTINTYSGSTFRNNIVLEEDSNQIPVSVETSHSGLTFSYNNWSKAAIAAAQGTGDRVGDPLLAKGSYAAGTLTGNYFKQSAGSPATNNGVTIASIPTDFFNVARPQGYAYDMGIYELISGADTTPPTVTITGPTSSTTYSTTSTTINISGTASDDTGVTSVTWSNNRGGSGSATGTTSWSQNSIQLYLGSNVLTVRAWDAAGLYSEDTLTVTLTDSTSPTVTIQTSSPQSIASDSLQVSFTSNDNIAVTETRWRIGAQPNGSTGTVCTSPATTSGYSVGANTLWIGARDASGNWGYSSITVNYTPASDGVSPTVTITTTKPAEIVADSMTLTWTDSDNVGVTERRWLIDAQPTAGTGTVATSPATVTAIRVGTQTVWVGVRDAAGNWAYDSIQVTRNYGADRKGVVLSGGGSF